MPLLSKHDMLSFEFTFAACGICGFELYINYIEIMFHYLFSSIKIMFVLVGSNLDHFG